MPPEMSMAERTNTLDRAAKPLPSALGEPSPWLFYLIFIWGVYLRFHMVTAPFPDNFEGADGGFMSMIARNWVRHGLWHLKLYQVMDGGPLVAGSELYTHHPPLIPLCIWFWFKVSGSFAEWCSRVAMITFSLGSVALLYLIVRRLWNGSVALLAGACYALMPYATYFSTDAGSYETGSQFFFLLILYWYLRYMDGQRFRHFAFMCLSLVIGSLNDWPAFYAVPLLGLHWFFLFPGKRRGYFLLFPVVAIVMMAVFLLIIAKAEGTWLIPQIAALKDPSLVYGIKPHTASELINQIVLNILLNLCTPVVLGLASVWIIGFFLRWARRQVTQQDIFLLILLSFGVLHTVLGREWAYTHDYWATVLMPGLSVAAAVVVYDFCNQGIIRYGHFGWVWKGLFYGAVLVFGIFCTHRFFQVHADRQSGNGYRVAQILKENTNFEDHILTTMDVTDAMYLRFYADRNIMCSAVTTVSQFANAYKTFYEGASWAGGPRLSAIDPSIGRGPTYRYFFLLNDDKTKYTALYDFLKQAYRMRAAKEFTIFDLNDGLVTDEELAAMLAAHRQPFDFYAHVEEADIEMQDPQAERPAVDTLTIKNVTRPTLNVSPNTNVVFRNVPLDSTSPLFKFAIAIPAEEWEKEGDGLIFKVTVGTGDKMYVFFSKYLNPKLNPLDRRWDEEVIDLSAFRNQSVDLALSVEYGPQAQARIGSWGSLELLDADALPSWEETVPP